MTTLKQILLRNLSDRFIKEALTLTPDDIYEELQKSVREWLQQKPKIIIVNTCGDCPYSFMITPIGLEEFYCQKVIDPKALRANKEIINRKLGDVSTKWSKIPEWCPLTNKLLEELKEKEKQKP